MQFWRSSIVIALAAAVWTNHTEAAHIDVQVHECSPQERQDSQCSWSIIIRGRIYTGDYERIRKLLALPPQQSLWKPDLIRIDSRGGDVKEAMEIGRLLRRQELTLVVPPDSSCISACVFILAGAVTRITLGSVGIHRPFIEDIGPRVTADELDEAYKWMFVRIRGYLSEMDIPPELADMMEAIPSEELKYLAWGEETAFLLNQPDPAFAADSYGISVDLYRQRNKEAHDKCQFPDPPRCRESRLWGLSEDEYTRRSDILGPQLKKLKGAPVEQIQACTIAIMAEGKESCE
jgi:hypothetical protein